MSLADRVQAWSRRAPDWTAGGGAPLDGAALLTFLMFVFYASDPTFPFMVFGPFSVAVLMAGIVWPALRRSRVLWLYVAFAVIWARLPELLVMDNHHWLIAYWCIAVAACLFADPERPGPLVARNARLLVGLAMVIAVFQKVRFGEFANGDFFEFLLLAGERFEAFSELVLRVPGGDLATNQQAVTRLLTPGASPKLVTEVSLVGPAWVGPAAVALSLWTLLIESVIGIAFLWPGASPWLRVLRHGSLLAFALSTYAIATVAGFAWILMILGVAQCDEEEDRLARFAYTGVFLLILLYGLPWGDWLRSA